VLAGDSPTTRHPPAGSHPLAAKPRGDAVSDSVLLGFSVLTSTTTGSGEAGSAAPVLDAGSSAVEPTPVATPESPAPNQAR
jgi:hypothetical protein